MFTPQEIQEKTFVKAVFGGYDMTCVDEFLEPLTEDYIALYKENAVLKSKMKVLVEKLEEYRGQEETMKKALVAATDASEKLKADTERKCAQLLNQAENVARNKANEAQQQIAAEEERVERAKQAAMNFIDVIEREVERHLDLLHSLKLMNLSSRTVKSRPYDFEREPAAPPMSEPEAESSSGDARQIANEIESNLEKVIGSDEETPPPTLVKPAVPQGTIKFSDLKFGKNYDPNQK